jgi:CDP-L-myo-inositol myo-inositolphosphotransferase
MIGGIFFFSGLTISGGILAQISSMIDSIDGQYARLKFKTTSFGRKLDTTLDFFVDLALLSSMSFHHYSIHRQVFIWIILFFNIVGIPSPVILKAKLNALKKGKRLKHPFLKRDIFMFLVFLGGILNLVLLPILYSLIGVLIRDISYICYIHRRNV